MKICLLHLSDTHISKSDGDWCSQANEKLKSSLSCFANKEQTLFIIFTGDITKTGSVEEFNVVKEWIFNLKICLKDNFKEIFLISVPGNHDCYLQEKDNIREMIIDKVINDGEQSISSSVIDLGVGTQKNYFDFVNEVELAKKIHPSVFWTYLFNISDKRISFNCYNSAWMSTLKDNERYGNFLFPLSLTDNSTTSEIVISLIHHPYNWFDYGNRHKLQNDLEAKSDIILTGHEHAYRLDHKKNSNDYSNLLLASKESKEGANLNFSFIEVDLDNLNYKVTNFIKSSHFEKQVTGFVRSNNSQRSKYPLKDEFYEWLNEFSNELSHHKKDRLYLSDVFVWPKLNKISDNENIENPYLDQNLYLDEFIKPGIRFIIGDQYSGKTSLAKSIMSSFNKKGKCPIWIDAGRIQNRHTENDKFLLLLSQELQEIYIGLNFESIPHEDRILIIDSVTLENINYTRLNKIISLASHAFCSVVLLLDETFKIAELTEKSVIAYEQYDIMKLKNRDMLFLIEKWISAGDSISDESIDHKVKYYHSLLRQALESNLIPNNPFYMLLYLNNAYALGGDGGDLSSSAALVEKMISNKHSTIPLSCLAIDGVANFLSEFSFFIYSKGEKYVTSNEFIQFLSDYCKEYSLSCTNINVLEVFKQKSVLRIEYDKVSFKDTYVYYYYLGKFLASGNLLEVTDKTIALENMINKCYREDYANIVVFASYFSNDSIIFDKVRIESQKILSDIEGIRLDQDIDSLVKKLNADVHKLTYDLKTDHKEKLAELTENQGKLFTNENAKEAPDDESSLVAKAFRYSQVLGMMAKNRTGRLKGTIKEETIKEVISLSSRLISVVIQSVDKNLDQMILDLLEKIEQDSIKEINREEIEKKIKQFIFRAFQHLVLVVVERISFHSGAMSLKTIFQEIDKKDSTNFSKLCEMQVSLDYSVQPEVAKLEKNARELSKNVFVHGVMRYMIFKYLSTTKLEQGIKQSLCQTYGIEIQKVNILAEKHK